MIEGTVSAEDVPVIALTLGGREWTATVDTGFNGYLELPEALRESLGAIFFGEVTSLLAGGQTVRERAYYVDIAFDGEPVIAEATFVEGDDILIGTKLLKDHRLTVDFHAHTVTLRRFTEFPTDEE